jgi:hypothetical protein
MKRPTRLAALVLAAAPLAGCGPDAPPPRNAAGSGAAAPDVPAPGAGPADPGAPEPRPQRPPIMTKQTDWPGVEGRLVSVDANGGLLLVEVQLANTGSAPVTIENFSAESAQMHNDVSKEIYGVFTPPGGQPAATTGLTQTLQPGETTTINATFPVPRQANLVTVGIPHVGLFEAIPLRPQALPKASPGKTP